MSIEIITPPAAEPVSIAEAKARLRVEHAEEDAAIAVMIAAARERVETHTGRALITRRVRERRDDWGPNVWTTGGRLAGFGARLRLGLGPVSVVHHVKVYADDDGETVLPSANYYVDGISVPSRIALRAGALWPFPGRAVDGIEIEYDAGYGESASAAPRPLVEAVCLLVAEAYEHRTPAERPTELALPPAVAGLLAPYARLAL